MAFDSYWLSPNSGGTENVTYRFGSVGQVLESCFCSLVRLYVIIVLDGNLIYCTMIHSFTTVLACSVQDTQLLLWDLELDEIAVPVRRFPGGSPTYSAGSQSSHWDSVCPIGTLQPAPSMRDIPKISPLVAHRVHTEPLSGLIFTAESVLTICREGHIKIWMRPGFADNQSNNAETVLSTSLKEKQSSLSSKVGSLSYKQ